MQKPEHCQKCIIFDSCQGFMRSTGSMRNGVLLVGEALGQQEAEAGEPFVGRAGETLEKILIRGGMTRDDFGIANVLWGRPPDNKLRDMWYEEDAIAHCAPYLDAEIAARKPKVIVGLGVIAFNRLLPEMARLHNVGLLDAKKVKGARGYVFWSDRYNCWIIPSVHPSYIMRGATAWAQSLIFDIQHAVEIAKDGYSYDQLEYTLDPTPMEAESWVQGYLDAALQDPDIFLSCDIETPEKDADEEDLDLEDCVNYTILRCGYSYKDKHALSIPWGGAYTAIHERLLSHPAAKCWWNGSFDQPRIWANKMVIGGASYDGMDAWHILNSDLRKGLGFVTTFFRRLPMWKHLSGDQPAHYNACDADAAGSNLRATIALLRKHKLWDVYEKFILELDPVYAAMTRAGMPVDREKRIESSKRLIVERQAIRDTIETVVPFDLKPRQPKMGYKKTPKDTTGMVEIVFEGQQITRCSQCGVEDPKKAHFKPKLVKLCARCGSKWTKAHVKATKKGNPCLGYGFTEQDMNDCSHAFPTTSMEGAKRWAKPLPFVVSPKSILAYQQFHHHPFIMVGQKDQKKPSTDKKAIHTLMGRYPDHPFYGLTEEEKDYTKTGGTYIGWWNDETQELEGGHPVGRDGRVHGIFRHTPSTLRSSMVSPNLQNLPRGDDSIIQKLVKGMYVAPEGWEFVARDFSGIEALLVGYEAGSESYYRLSKIDVHSYFTAHQLYDQKLLTSADLPELSWSDADLTGYLKGIKKRFAAQRNIGKRCIHAGNYRVGGKLLHETYPLWFPATRDATRALRLYYDVFPEIDHWHERVCLQTDKVTTIKNAFGHVHRFYQVLKWTKVGGEWTWDYGEDAKRLIAFVPQSNAALIGKAALKRCYYGYPDSVAEWLRLFIHDEIFTETPSNRADECDAVLVEEMEKPIPELPLPASWNRGSHVVVATEGKRGRSWADM